MFSKTYETSTLSNELNRIKLAMKLHKNKGFTQGLTNYEAAKRYAVSVEIPYVHALNTVQHESFTLGVCVDAVNEGAREILENYTLAYYLDTYGTVAVGGWYNEDDKEIEISITATFEDLEIALLVARNLDETYIYDTVEGWAINVEEASFYRGVRP